MREFVVAVCMAVAVSVAAAGEAVKLPSPEKSGGADILTAIDNRGSGAQSDFPTGELSDQDYSTLLWAASGRNRDGDKWTVPMALGKPPYCTIYVVTKNGSFAYNWRNNTLDLVSGEDYRHDIPMQAFAQEAPATLVVVADGVELSKLSGPFTQEFAAVLAGAMSQNVYLAGQAIDVAARVVYSINRDTTSRLLKLAGNDTPLFGIVLGKR